MNNHPTRRPSSIAALMIGTFLCSGVSRAPAAGDWPQWHGPKRDNVSTETGLLKQWPAEGPKLLWKAQPLGEGYSSVTVADGKIFTMGDIGGSAYVIVLNEADGKPLWKTKIDRAGEYGGYEGPRATPSYDNGLLYALSQHGTLTCLDARSGKPQWSHSLTQELKGSLPGWGYAESPLVEGDLVLCTPGGGGGTMAAFNKKTGRLAWRTTDWKDEAHYVSPVPATFGRTRQVIQMTDKTLAGVEAKTGKLLWRADRPGRVAVIPSPLVRDGLVFTTSGYNVGCNLFQVTPAAGNSFAAKQVYANADLANHHGGVVLVGDHVYGTDERMLVCMELKSGKVAWKDRSVGKGATAFADGMLYVRSEGDGKVALVEATPEGYQEKGTFEQPDRSNKQAWPHPVITGGRLYLRDQDVLLCYDVKAN